MVGLYGPGVDRLPSEIGGVGLVTMGNTVAAVASSSRPFGVARLGVNVGRVGTVDREGIEPKPLEPGLVNGVSRKQLYLPIYLLSSTLIWIVC